MNDYTWTGQITAPLAIVLGMLACFWGYRIVKLTLTLTGLIVGAAGGWAAATALAPGHPGIALVCAGVLGVLGAVLCLWLFHFGVFLLGASAGAVIAAAVVNGTGYAAQPLIILVAAVVAGLVALLLQKFMIVVATAFCGSYLVTGGIWHLAGLGHNTTPLWFERAPPGMAGTLSYFALAFWLVLGLVGVRFQYRGRRRREEAAPPKAPPS